LNARISVIIPTYRRPELIGGCLDALDRQSTPPLEVIVVDQSPDSKTRDIVQGRSAGSAPVRYLHSDRAGVSLARNIGIRESRGALLAFTDDDALPEPRWLESIAAAFVATHPSAGLVGGRILPLWEKPRPPWYPSSFEYLLPVFDHGGGLAPFPQGSLPMTVNLSVTREVIDKLGGFHEEVGPRTGWRISGEDSHFAWKAIEACVPVYYQPEAVVLHRVPASRMTRRFLLDRCWLEGISLLDIEEKRGILSDERLRGHIGWHRRRALQKVASLAKFPSVLFWNDPRVLEALGGAATNLSIVHRARQLLALRRPESA
jgi:glycosyltransferase involved in cell wall biosynthesis